MAELPAGVVTFLFTDIEGSTSLFGKLGSGFRAVLDEHNRLLRAAFERVGGVEVKTEGDSFFVAFPDARKAVASCVEAQLTLADAGGAGAPIVRVRMGLHTGYADPVDRDYVALAVNQAARVSAAGHGGQILVSSDTAAAAGAGDDWSVERIGLFRLKGFDKPEPLFQVTHPKLPSIFPALHAPAVLRTNLPHLAARMLGREESLAKVGAALRRERVITLVGAGGVGKSTLALHAADAAAGAYAGGAWLVELGAVSEASLVPEAVAAALGVLGAGEGSQIVTLEHRLSGEPTLLVLDGAERVAPAVAELLGHLLPRCPGLTAVVASRRPLDLDEEWVFELAPLAVPARSTEGDAEAVLANPAVKLLRERWARAVHDDLPEPDPDEIAMLAAICRSVDGIPLALELVGAALGSSTPSQVLEGLLAGNVDGDEDTIAAPLRASLAWSYELLDDAQAACFRRLAAFDGDPTLEAVTAVCSGNGNGGLVAELVIGLSDRSLAQLRRVDGRVRVRMLDTVRSFAREQLGRCGETRSAADEHLRWYLATAGAQVDAATRWNRERTQVLRALAPEIEDLRRAIAHGAATRPELGVVRLGRVAGAACRRLSRGWEAKLCLEAAVAVAPAGSDERSHALVDLGYVCLDFDDPSACDVGRQALDDAVRACSRETESLASALLAIATWRYGSADEAEEYGQRALSLAEAVDDDDIRISAHRAAGLVADARGDYRAQHDHNAIALELTRPTGDGQGLFLVMSNLAVSLQRVGTWAEAEAMTIESRNVSTALERGMWDAYLLALLSFMALGRGALEEAWAKAQESLEVAREHGIPHVVAYALNQVGEVALARGDLAAAIDTYGEALGMTRNIERVSYCLDGIAAIAARVGDDATVVSALAVLDRFCADASFHLPDDYLGPNEDRTIAARERLGPAAFGEAWAAGRALAIEEAIRTLPARVAASVARAGVGREASDAR